MSSVEYLSIELTLSNPLPPPPSLLSVQSTFELYEYPCKKFKPEIRNRKDPAAPTANEVCEYLEDYINEKKMRSKFRFNTNIAGVLCTAEDNWIIEFDDFSTATFTYVIVCNGLVSSKPNIFPIQGRNDFEAKGGKVIHSSARRNDDLFQEARRVVVVGNGKSAVDAATAAAEIAKAKGGPPPVQLARRQTWYVPRYLLGVLQYKWAFHTRLGSALLPRYYESSSLLLQFLHSFFAPLKWFIWRVLEILLICQYRLPVRLWPKMGTIVRGALETSVLITDAEHLVRLRKGTIDMQLGEIKNLEPGRVILKSGDVLEDVDVVVLATGWRLSYDQFMDFDDIFAGLDYQKDTLDFCDDGLWLYRNVLPASFKGMAFVGANTLTFMNIYTSYIQAYWLAEMLAGKRDWPTEEHMKETVGREKEFKRQYYKSSEMRGASVEAYMQHYHDCLFREMKAKSPFNCLIRPVASMVVPILPCTMKGCFGPPSSHGIQHSSTQQNEDKERHQKTLKEGFQDEINVQDHSETGLHTVASV